MFTRLAATLGVLMVATTTLAADAAITFRDAYALDSAATVGVAFFTATSATDDAIVGASSDCCKAVEMHRMEMKENIMRMRKIDRLPMKAGVSLNVHRNSSEELHVMLIGLKKPLKAGDVVPVTFSFEKAPEQTVSFVVKNAKAPHSKDSSVTPATANEHHH